MSRINGAPVRYQKVRAFVVAAGCVATSTIRWVDRTPETYDTYLMVFAFIAAVTVLVTTFVVGFHRLRAWAYGLASWVLLADGAQSIIAQEQKTASILRTDLFAWALAILALDSMMSYQDEQRRARKAEA